MSSPQWSRSRARNENAQSVPCVFPASCAYQCCSLNSCAKSWMNVARTCATFTAARKQGPSPWCSTGSPTQNRVRAGTHAVPLLRIVNRRLCASRIDRGPLRAVADDASLTQHHLHRGHSMASRPAYRRPGVLPSPSAEPSSPNGMRSPTFLPDSASHPSLQAMRAAFVAFS